jgi:Flp pilus assembly protein TadB
MAELSAALVAGIAVTTAVLLLGGAGAPPRLRRLGALAASCLRRLVDAEGDRAGAAGLQLGARFMVTIELLLGGSAGAVGYWLTGMPALALATSAFGVGALRGLLAVRSTTLRRERQDAVVAAVRTLRQLLETGAVGVGGALEIVAQRGPVALRPDFQAVIAGGLGPAAWARARRRVGESVFDLLSAAILVQRPGGGELGPLFRELEESVTAVHEVEREAAALQVQARSASTLILCLPLAFLAVLCLLRSPYLEVYRTAPGQLFLAAMLAVMAAAHVLIRRWLRLPEEPRLELAGA